MRGITSTVWLAAAALTACTDFDALLDDCVARGGCVEDSGEDAGAPDAGTGDAGVCITQCSAGCAQRRSDGGYGQYVTAARTMPSCMGGPQKCDSLSCGAYVCADSACGIDCARTADCTDDSWCSSAKQCVPRVDLDATCTDPESCLSRRCTHRAGVLRCSQCQTNEDCDAKAAVCDVDAGRCVACTQPADCISAGLGNFCVGGRCACSSSTCANDRSPSCHNDGGCGCGGGPPCLLGQVCSDAGTCLLVAKQPCVGAGQCLNACVNGTCQ